MCMFGNRERRRKEKRRMYFFFLWLVCHIEGNEKKIYVFSLLCPYKCTKCIKVMGKYVTSCHTILFMLAPFFKTIFYLQNPPNSGRLQICGLQKKWFLPFSLFVCSMITKQRKGLHFFLFFFFSSLL